MRARRWARRLAIAAALLPVAYLLLLHLWLDSGLAERQLSRGERFRIRWSSAWSLWPGHVTARGLRLGGRAGGTEWSVAADRAAGVLDLSALARRQALFSAVRAEGVSTRVVRATSPEQASTAKKRGGSRGGGSRWRLRFDDVRLDGVRRIQLRDWVFSGTGAATGTFDLVPGRRFALERSRLEMRDAAVDAGATPLARRLALDATATLGPYDPREHRGLSVLDLVSGVLSARGESPALARLGRRLGSAAVAPPVTLAARVVGGRLQAGTRFEAGTAAQTGPRLHADVEGAAADAVLALGASARDLTMGAAAPGSLRFHAGALEVSARSAETRLLALIAASRELRGGTAARPLLGDLLARDVEIEAPGHRARLHATAEHVSARIDLTALLRQDLVLPSVDAAAVAVDLVPGSGVASAPSTARPGWSLDLGGARLHSLRELTVADYRVAGDGNLAVALRYDRAGVLSVARQALELRDGRFDVRGEAAANELNAHVSGGMQPVTLGPGARAAILRAVSARADFHAAIGSLGFLAPFLERSGWLTLSGAGSLDGRVAVEAGRMLPGSQLHVRAEPVRARVLDSIAAGSGAVDATIEGTTPGTSSTAVRVHFDSFGFTDAQRSRRAAYLRGNDLTLLARAPGAVDLAALPGGFPDVTASVDLTDGELPDLSIYDALLPAGSGVRVLGGRGRVRLHLEASSATRAASGRLELTASGAALRFQDLAIAGKVTLRAPLRSRDVLTRRFDLGGAELSLDEIAYGDVAATERTAGWWAKGRLADADLRWGAPLQLAAHVSLTMKDSGPLLAVFGQHAHGAKRLLVRWLDDALAVQNVVARSGVRVTPGRIDIDDLKATSGKLEVRTRMSFAAGSKRGDLYVRYGNLAGGVALKDGQRTLKLRKALEWYEGGGDRR